MRKVKLIIVVVMVAIAVTLIAFVASSPSRGSVRYHIERLGSLQQQGPLIGPSSFADYFRLRTWSWYLRGKPSISDGVAALEEEQQALIRLGHFERRELTFSHRTLDTQLWSEFRSAVSNSSLAGSCYMLHLDESRPSVIRVTTCKTDISVFERIVTQLDTNLKK